MGEADAACSQSGIFGISGARADVTRWTRGAVENFGRRCEMLFEILCMPGAVRNDSVRHRRHPFLENFRTNYARKASALGVNSRQDGSRIRLGRLAEKEIPTSAAKGAAEMGHP